MMDTRDRIVVTSVLMDVTELQINTDKKGLLATNLQNFIALLKCR